MEEGAERAVEASAGALRIDGARWRVRSATYDDGVLRLDGALGLGSVELLATVDQADGLVAALAVRERGVRTLDAWGPLASIPVLGLGLLWGAPLLATLSLLVLGGAWRMDRGAVFFFAVLFVGSLALSVLALSPGRLHVSAHALELRWLWRSEAIPLSHVESLRASGATLLVTLKSGQVRRVPLVPSGDSTDSDLAAVYARTARRAEGPIALARTGSLARVFE